MAPVRLRILVIDDSSHNRVLIKDILRSIPGAEVVAVAEDGEQALKLVGTLRPDLITLDLEMPRMDGFTFLRLLMAQWPTPVIVISTQSRKQDVFQILELGALDFVAKPTRVSDEGLEQLRQELTHKVTALMGLGVMPQVRPVAVAAVVRERLARPSPVVQPARLPTQPMSPSSSYARSPSSASLGTFAPAPSLRLPPTALICIAASTGGPAALHQLMRTLPVLPGVAVLVAQHMPENFTRAFASRLGRIAAMPVQEAEPHLPIWAGHVYIAPGGAHLEVAMQGGEAVCRIIGRDLAELNCPAADRLFISAAQHFGAQVLAVVLTGMGADGSRGALAVRDVGGRVLAESPDSAVVGGMPREAVKTGAVHSILALEALPAALVDFAHRR